MWPGPVNKNWGPGRVNTNWGWGKVNKNWGPGQVNINWGPGPGAKQRAGGREIQRATFFLETTFLFTFRSINCNITDFSDFNILLFL